MAENVGNEVLKPYMHQNNYSSVQKCFFLFELNIFFPNSLLKQTEYVCF